MAKLPLHCAVRHSEPRLNIVAFLAEQWHGSLTVRNNEGLIPLHLAILRESSDQPCPEMIRYLAERCPASLKVPGGGKAESHQALHFAAMRQLKGEVVSMLTAICPDSVQQTDSNGDLPLHVATRHRCQLEMIQALLQAWRASVMEVNKRGDLPLHLELTDCQCNFVQQDMVTHLGGTLNALPRPAKLV